MTTWTDFLDAIAHQDPRAEPPKFVRIFRFPGLDRWEPGRIWARWEVDPEFLSPAGTLFGGYLAALADNLFGLVMFTVLEEGENFTTSDLEVRFIRPVTSGHIDAEVTILNRGRRMVACEAVFTRDDGKLAAKASATQVIISTS
jgi:uncharacterized protein (TIGR00369 family)